MSSEVAGNLEASEDTNEPFDSNSNSGALHKVCRRPNPHVGWLIVFASFLSHFICCGFANSCGLYFLEWMDYFEGSSSSQISCIGSILLGMMLMTGKR